MSNELSNEDAQKLFNQISKANQEDDSSKLSEIMDKQPDTDQVPIVKDLPDDQPNVEDDKEETDTKVSDDTNNPPDDKPGDDDGNKDDKDQTPEQKEFAALKEQYEKVTKENHSLRSQAGRVPHVQRRIQELDKKLEELTKRNASPSSQPSATIQPKIAELLKGVKETDPELADTIAAAIAAATDGVAGEMRASEENTLRLLRTQEVNSYQAEQTQALLEQYPNAPEVFASPSWKEWKESQSDRIRGLAQSDTADDVSFAFEKYARDMLTKYPDLAVNGEAKVETPPAKTDTQLKAEQLEAERKRKKESSVNISNPSDAGKVGMPDDPEALFKKYSEEIRKTITG